MGNFLAQNFGLLVFLFLAFTGYVFGRAAEGRHYISIRKREQELRHLLILTEKQVPPELEGYAGTLVAGSVVISVDYFKTVISGLRAIVGGRMSAYESLLDRARREALLRMQTAAAELGAQAILNLKFETSRISGNAGRGIGSVEVLAYGTAMIPGRHAPRPDRTHAA